MPDAIEPRTFLAHDWQFAACSSPNWIIPIGESEDRLAIAVTMHVHCRAISDTIRNKHGLNGRSVVSAQLGYPKAATLTRVLNGQDRLSVDTVALAVELLGPSAFPTREGLTNHLEYAKETAVRVQPRTDTEGLLTADQINRFTTGAWHAAAVSAITDIGHHHDLDDHWATKPDITVTIANATDPSDTGLVYGHPTPTGADLTIYADADWWQRNEQFGGPVLDGFFVTAWHDQDLAGNPSRVSVLVLLPSDPDDLDGEGPQEFASVPVDVTWGQPDSPSISIEMTPDLTRWWLTRTGRDLPTPIDPTS